MKTKNKKIYSYKSKVKLDDKIITSINNNKNYILPLKLPKKTNINEKEDSIKNDSLATLREYIKSPKPYVVTSSIRKKIKNIKIAENEGLDNFYSSTIKANSARHNKNELIKNYFKNNSYSIISKNKKLKITGDDFFKNNNLNIDIAYKTNYNFNNIKSYKNKNVSNNKINFSFFSNSKTDYSTLPTAALTSRNFYKKPSYINFNSEPKNYYEDSLGYKNANMKEPTYAKKGAIRSFMNDIDIIRKNNYKNYCLKLYEFKKNILYENILCQIHLDEKTKTLANYYLNKYNDGYNIYWYKLKKKINKECDINDNLEYQIKNLKIEINKLTIKIQKLLIKLSIFDEIRVFLFELKQFSSYPFGTPYSQLMELKNKLMEKIKHNEEQTNINIYLLNKKDVGIDIFLNKYKDSKENLNNENGKNNILTDIDEFIDVPDKIDSNIKNLLWKQNILEREIDSLSLKLYDILDELKNDKIYEKKLTNQYNIFIKTISGLKTENQYLNYKVEILKNKNKNDKYGKLNKNISIKIIQIINNFNKTGFITKEDNSELKKIFQKDMIKYLLMCLTIMEKTIIYLLKFKKEVINKEPILKKKFELNCKYEAVLRKKKQEQNERYNQIRNTVNKLNKIKYINDIKDYYYINRKAYINKCKKITKEKERQLNEKKTSIEIVMNII